MGLSQGKAKEEDSEKERETLNRIQGKLDEFRKRRQEKDRMYASNPNISADDSGFTSPQQSFRLNILDRSRQSMRFQPLKADLKNDASTLMKLNKQTSLLSEKGTSSFGGGRGIQTFNNKLELFSEDPYYE